jgi:lauroyl/myristoyl acyltransferase
VLPLYIVREAGARFTLHAGPEPTDWAAHLEAARRGHPEPGIEALNAAVEPVVRAHLDQWFMLHELRLADAASGRPERDGAMP